jgi:translation initiation factor eIF-2B subunit delta
MGNAIRHLKSAIIKIDPAVPEHVAKESLLETIDAYIRERVTAADEFIAASAAEKISDGDVVLTYANSSIVRKTLIRAYTDVKNPKKFSVIVVDSSPLFEGKRLASALLNVGIPVTYYLMTGVSHAAKDATKCFLGAHAMLGNGRLYARIGTAVVAMHAHEHDVPVIVCCESYKFTDRVQLDSFVGNEIAPAEELLGPELSGVPEFQPVPEKEVSGGNQKGGKGGKPPPKEEEDVSGRQGMLKKWTDTPNLQLLNLMYDVTPTDYIKMVVTEHGSLPPSSVPVVHRISTDKDQ